jgi:TatD DNase family protein
MTCPKSQNPKKLKLVITFARMKFVDTHCHLYLPEFAGDRQETIEKAIESGVTKIILPNIDATSWQPMLDLSLQYKGVCYAMAGLHPTSVVPDTIEQELAEVERQLELNDFVAIGEIGIDLYWDRTHQQLQEEVFRTQLQWAKKYKLPVAIHIRNSYNEVWRILKQELTPDLKGVLHCFPGNVIQAAQAIEAGFKLGIGGVVTFKNSGMQEVVKAVGPEHIILETDAPFLAPAPYRGKRNEPSYIPLVAAKVAELCSVSIEEVAEITTRNAEELFSKMSE